jgi:hypothetical protein
MPRTQALQTPALPPTRPRPNRSEHHVLVFGTPAQGCLTHQSTMSRQLQSCIWGPCVAVPAVIGEPQPAQAERCTRGSSHSSEMLRTTARRACSAPAMRCRDGRRAPEQDRHRTREPAAAPACSAARQGACEAVRSSFCTQGSKQAPSGSRAGRHARRSQKQAPPQHSVRACEICC